MKEGQDKIKDLFSSKLQSFEPEVPASIWGGLDQLLSQQPAPAVDSSSSTSNSSSASSTTKASTIKTALITVGIVAAVATGILLMPKGEKVKNEEKKEIIKEEPPISIEPEKEIISEPEIRVITPIPSTRVEEKVVEPEPVIVEQAKPEPKKEEVPEKPVIKEELPVIETEPEPKPASLPKGLSFGIYGGYGLSAHEVTERGGQMLFSHPHRSNAFNSLLKDENSEFTLKHKQPISLGISIGKQITPRLGLETGLVFTRLSSDIVSPSKFNISESQTFDYLGLPLSLNYTIFNLGKGKLYLSVGGMVQKDIKGQYISNMDFPKSVIVDPILADQIYYTEAYYIKENIKQQNLQFSTHARLGIAYPLYKKLYLYGTFGGVYFFDAENKYRTIFTDKKTQLDLNLGVKFDF